MNSETYFPSTPEPVVVSKEKQEEETVSNLLSSTNPENREVTLAPDDQVMVTIKNRTLAAEVVSVQGKNVTVRYQLRNQLITTTVKLEQVTPLKNMSQRTVTEASALQSSSRQEATEPVKERVDSLPEAPPVDQLDQADVATPEPIIMPSAIPEPPLSLGVAEAIPRTSALEQTDAMKVEEMKLLLAKSLEMTGYDAALKVKISNQIDRAIQRTVHNLPAQERALRVIFERLYYQWEHETRVLPVTPEQLVADMEPLTAFLGDPASRKKISIFKYATLLKLRQRLVNAYARLQGVDEPNPSESDPKTRKNILRKYSNIATNALREAATIMNTSNAPQLGALVGSQQSEAVTPALNNSEPEAEEELVQPEVVGPMQLTAAMRVPVKTVPEVDSTTPLSTQSPIPPGPTVNFIRTEEIVLPDIPAPVNRPGVVEDSQRKETLLPLDEKLYELRQTKNAYVQALSRAIQMKTLARQGEQAAFAEGALRAVEAASDAYYHSLSKVQLQMAQNVSSTFAITKDSEVVKNERDFYDENTVTNTIKNIAGILRKKLFGNVVPAVNQMPESNAAPLPGVTRAFSDLATEVPADPHMSFNEMVPPAEPVVPAPETFERYDGVEDISDTDRVTFPPFGKAKDIDITDAVSDDVVRIEPGAIDTSSTVLEADVVESTAETLPATEITLSKIYAYLHNFPDGLDALSDRVKGWIYQTEGLHGSRPNVPGRSFFTSAQLATPYEALKLKTVREILALHKSKSGVAHALDELHLTPAGFAIWANRLAKFELNYPGINIQVEPLREAVKILFAVEQLESPVNIHNI